MAKKLKEVKQNKKLLEVLDRLMPVLFVLVFVLTFTVGALWQKVQILEKGGTANVAANNVAVGNQAQGGPSPLSVDSLKKYAKELKLDEKKFNSCLDNGDQAADVKADLTYGSQVGVNGTPAFYLNGYMISGAQPYDVFKKAIDFLLKGGDFSKPDATVKDITDGNPQNGEISVTKANVEVGNAPIEGNANAAITIVEFSDFECPFCESFYTNSLKLIRSEYVNTGKVKLAYRHFPLTFHPNAQKAAEAAECANEQGKFWEMHDKLFSVQAR